MLQSMSSSGVLPRETLLEWWRKQQLSNSSGMILKSNHVVQFFAGLQREEDEEDEDNKLSLAPCSLIDVVAKRET